MTVEFLLLIVVFALPVSLAFLSLGMPLLRMFRYAQMSMVGPFP